MLEPKELAKVDVILNHSIKTNAMIMEFKVHDPEKEETLQDTVTSRSGNQCDDISAFPPFLDKFCFINIKTV